MVLMVSLLGDGMYWKARSHRSRLTLCRLFIVEGVTTIGCAFVAPFTLLDYPHNSRQFTAEEKELAVKRLRADGITGHSDGERRMSLLQALVKTVSNWRLWLLCIGYMTIIGAYSLSYFYPTLVNGLGYTATTAQSVLQPCPTV
jgi:hypothetical protein